MNYSEKLADPRWQRKRLEIMNRDNWTCQRCGDATTQLEIHHVDYWEGKKPWEYPDDMLVTVCRPCHQREDERPKHEKYLLQSMKNYGFLSGDLLALSVLLGEDNFRKFLLRKIREFSNK
jgi:hypothetical protein